MNAGLIVARNIRRLRVAKGLSQEAFADAAQIDRSYVGGLERQEKSPTVPVLERIAKALNCDIRELFDPEPVARSQKPLRGGRKKK